MMVGSPRSSGKPRPLNGRMQRGAAIEIVSDTFASPEPKPNQHLTCLKEIILYTGVSDCKYQRGFVALRRQHLVRASRADRKNWNPRMEVKNVNLFPFSPVKLLQYGVFDREIGYLIESGGRITQERLTAPAKARPMVCALSEQAHDYASCSWISLPPWRCKVARKFAKHWWRAESAWWRNGITEQDAQVLTISAAGPVQSKPKQPKSPKCCGQSCPGELMGWFGN